MAKRTHDWDRIEADYRTGKFTLRELGVKHGLSHVAIARRVSAKGWAKDLTEEIRVRTKAALAQRAADQQVTEVTGKLTDASDTAVAVNVAVIEGHRTGLQRLQRLADQLADELDNANVAASRIDDDDLAMLAASRGLSIKQIGNLLEAAEISSRAQTADKLAAVYAKVIPLQRKAHGLDKDEGDEADSFDAWLKANPKAAL